MSLDIMFLTNDNLNRMRREQQVLGLRYRGLTNGLENDQNTANIPADLSHTRLSISSTASNQSYDSGNVDYAVPKHPHPKHRSDAIDSNDNLTFPPKITNPLFGVDAAEHYSPGVPHDTDKQYDRPIPNGVRRAPEGRDNEAFRAEDVADGRTPAQGTHDNILADGGTATYTTDSNGKINVHVTVMINAGTLADLKKQRAQIRTNGSPVENSVSSTANHSLNSIPEAKASPLPPPGAPQQGAPALAVPRFSGNTSDVVSDSKSHRCCIIM